MREILFRGKRLDNGDWVEGYLYEHEPPLVGIVSEKDEPEASKWFIARTGFADWNMPRPVELVKVDPSTVGQYTGLTDKNGKQIFEGDIVQYHERQFDGKDVPVRDAVIYEEGGFSVRAYFLNNWLWNSINGNTQLRDVEIIGNIHDKPKLLKEGADNG